MNAGVVALLYFGGFKVNIGHLEQGQVLALINYMNQMLLALIVVSNLVVLFTRAAASANRINEVFATDTTLADDGTTQQADEQAPLIDFQNVDFRYTEKSGLALQDISFTMEENNFLGITGATGSGKSTLISLIPRFTMRQGAVSTLLEAMSKTGNWIACVLKSHLCRKQPSYSVAPFEKTCNGANPMQQMKNVGRPCLLPRLVNL